MKQTEKRSTGFNSTGEFSTGSYSTGSYSTGSYSTGDYSTGHWSTGNRSTGDYSTGDYSVGNYSTGENSTGDYSTGACSTGDFSTGDHSTGHDSTGCSSTGDGSTGERSTGDYSTGCWSTSNFSTGYFSTINYMGLSLFNKPITEEELENIDFPFFLYFNLTEWIDENEMTDEEKEKNPSYSTTGGFLKVYEYKEAFKKAYNSASLEEKKQLLEIPHFDSDIFLEISGIDVRLDKELYPDETESKVADNK